SPPSIPGVGSSGGVTFIVEDRSGRQDVTFLARNVEKFIDAAKKRPELSELSTTQLPEVPQIFIKVDRDKVLKQGVPLNDVYRTLQTFMGGYFVNYFQPLRAAMAGLHRSGGRVPGARGEHRLVLRSQQSGTNSA